jgi:predicted nucleotidyltransferase
MGRTQSPLDALLPRTRQAILCAVLLHAERAWYLAELARHLETHPSSLQRELARLVAAGILVARRDGNRVYYQANVECPFLAELQGLLRKTAGLVDVLRRAIEPLDGAVRLAFVFGSTARGEERPTSDVDVFVVGDIGLAALAPTLRHAERAIGRAINPVTMTVEEFRQRIRDGDHFVTSLLQTQRLFLVGADDDLAGATGGP